MTITIEDGELRAILGDDVDSPELCDSLDAPVQRASSIEPIVEGSRRGWWQVDFMPLFKTTGDVQYACCLSQLFSSKAEALLAEVKWLEKHFLGLEV